jgi:hypothetical protein
VAGLRSPELTSDSQRASSGIDPWWWALLLVLVAAAAGTWLWLRRRGGSVASPEATDPGDSGDATSNATATAETADDLDDDWPAFPVLDDEPTITR